MAGIKMIPTQSQYYLNAFRIVLFEAFYCEIGAYSQLQKYFIHRNLLFSIKIKQGWT